MCFCENILLKMFPGLNLAFKIISFNLNYVKLLTQKISNLKRSYKKSFYRIQLALFVALHNE
jgi:hypothetical protein